MGKQWAEHEVEWASGGQKFKLFNCPELPSINPDGTKIAFWSNRNHKSEIYLMNVDGTNVLNVTNNGANNFEPVFSPNSNDIAFTSDKDGNIEIYSIYADGSGLKRLTNHPALDTSPDWR